MKSKLTLRLDESLIKEAKNYAHDKDESLSSIVSKFFALLSKNNNDDSKSETGPITTSLTGIITNTDLDENDFRKHLESKHS